MIASGDDMAYNEFLNTYIRFSSYLIKEYLEKHPIYDFIRDDLHSIVLCETISLIAKYEVDKGPFYPFWRVASLRVINYYLKRNYQLIVKSSGALSLDYISVNNHPLHDSISLKENPDENNLLCETFVRIVDDPINGVKRKEREVIKLYLNGYTFREISEIINRSASTVYSLYKRAVAKIGIAMKDPKK